MNDIHLDIGCGMRKADGWIGLDIRQYKGVDHVLNIGSDAFPLPDDSCIEIKAIHVLEHLYPQELFHCMEEAWRVCNPKGSFYIEVPKAGTPAYYIHPDHKIQFVADTFGFFNVPSDLDVHGYLNGFWHVAVEDLEQSIQATLYPNKPNGKYPYKEVKRVG